MRIKRSRCARFPFSLFHFLLAASLGALLLSPSAGAQSLGDDLRAFTARPAVTGYEQWLAGEISKRLSRWKPQQDNMGNLWVTLGSGDPKRLIVAPMDEPGYIVSGITEDGYLRVQRLPQATPHGLFDQLHSAQPAVIHTRKGKWVFGVFAGLSTHLQGGRRDAPRMNHPDDIYVDLGASSAAEVKKAGVDILDPIGLDRELYSMAGGRLTAPGVGDRFGAVALLAMLERLDQAKLRGTLTVAFVAQQWASSRGLDRLMPQIKPDEMVYVGRLLPRRAGFGGQGQGQRQQMPAAPRKEPGSGVLLATEMAGAQLAEFPLEISRLAGDSRIPLVTEVAAPLPRVSYTRGPELPKRFAHLGIATAWPNTPAEFMDLKDLMALAGLLTAYAQGAPYPAQESPATTIEIKRPAWGRPQAAPPVTEILEKLVESYGVSGHEKNVQEDVARLLPSWAKPETDSAGNLWLRLETLPTVKKPNRIVFVAHMDEIGYVVRRIAEDGHLEVQSRGGGTQYFFSGHAMLVHTAGGIRAGVMELPSGWEQPDFEWPRGGGGGAAAAAAAAAAASGEGQAAPAGPAQAPRVLRVDVGARSAAEAAELGFKAGDSITVPKKYRPLYGTRANGRSFDDRVGCTALVAAAWALGHTANGGQAMPKLPVDVTFLWATEEEVGLLGAKAYADSLAQKGEIVDFVFAVDTFVSSDSPIESHRFANAPIGKGFVIRAVDGSNIANRKHVDRLIQMARANQIPVQYGATGGGNDGAVFLRHGAVDIPIAWPLRYSHSPGEVIDTRDVDALARIVAAIARSW